MRQNDVATEIRELLNSRIAQICDYFYGGWITDPSNKHKGLMTPAKKGKRISSSFTVNLDGDRQGQWYRFSQQIGGGSVELVAYALGYEPKSAEGYREAFKWARGWLGIDDRQETEEDRKEREARQAKDREARERTRQEREQAVLERAQRKAVTAAEIAKQCRPILDTAAEQYLCGAGQGQRRLPPVSAWPTDLREHIGFHPGLEMENLRQYRDEKLIKKGPSFPALVFFLQDPFGDIVSLQRIFLDAAMGVKITQTNDTIPNAKVMFAASSGAACRIGGDASRIGLLEGGETALGNWALHDFRYPMWATMSTSGMVTFEAPGFVERSDIFPDSDNAISEGEKVGEPPGTKAAEQCAANLRQVGVHVVINEPCIYKCDNLDLWETYSAFEQRHPAA
ncbi:hypothetical protein PsAD2_02988 [Pseudovibrio axinellae]|uniref:Toprim domain-containing protein n=1 Tax=Pseudovibrio axinellae TaxID=989403 RepID=A0A165XF97_9HYPH|nr:toprim domain-containing protein [Pseudovibrio axinellae]KZL17652.1 hypothetical protein PsAD2_02988 [Pseudovibrio axinellae]SER44892.1 Toprim domain-containing protein [Pseudovibrio axinellae]